MRWDFSGHNVLVIGGSSGINLGIAQGFAQAGAKLGVVSRSHEKVDAAEEKYGDNADSMIWVCVAFAFGTIC